MCAQLLSCVLLLSLRMEPAQLTNLRDKGREGKQGMTSHAGELLFSKSECFGKFYCGNTRIFLFLGSSISPFHPTVLSSGAGIAGNGHS